jgi:hypothetical protein
LLRDLQGISACGFAGLAEGGEELSHLLCRVSLFQVASKGCQLGSDFAGNLGGVAGGIERVRVEPEGAEAFAIDGVGKFA